MGYGFYTVWIDGEERRAGYGVRCLCDEPGCEAVIDRGLAYVCGRDPGETEHGCGRYFCGKHLRYRRYRGEKQLTQNCDRCLRGRSPHPMKSDIPETGEQPA